ncbi:ketoacyl-ACP synthase III [uncultured Bacteroides sp.]|uniref:3-oxoacyl-ACP synthase III family protein n=1 Tax=uncultured Bacteroides sp. TaxID=162156 RepID=UPI002AAB0322|nr:ketoacyl-ACP synthase III [uncultured Bacteroides sp.]
MAYLSFPNVKFAGIAAAVPKEIKEVKDWPVFVPGEAEKVIGLTHIERARIAPEGLCCSDLCFEAADKLINELKWDRNEIEALIFVSLSRDYLLPATSCLLQDRLGLSKDCYAIDVPLGCSGYTYGLSVVSGLVSNGSIKKALLLVGETTSTFHSPLDKTIWPLIGDAGTATAIEFDEGNEGIVFQMGTDGSKGNAIISPDGGARNPVTNESFIMKEVAPGISRNRMQVIMDGLNVFAFSITQPPKSIMDLCEHFNLDLNNIDYFLIHQANHYMDEKIGRKLKADQSKIPYSLTEFGNTSCATIPLTMVTELNAVLQEKELSLIMCSFGAGLSWGSAFLKTNQICCPPLIEI